MPPLLPNEILQSIFSLLQLNLRTKGHGHALDNVSQSNLDEELSRQFTLSHISRASKLFRGLALLILYHTIPSTSARLLVNRAKSPDLARLVKVIDLSTKGIIASSLSTAFESAKPRLSLSPTFERRVQRAIDGVGDDLNDTGAEPVLHLLLLDNIEALEYRSYIGSNAIVTEFFRGVAPAVHDNEETPQIPQLRELRVRHWSEENTTRITQVQRLVLSSVEKLHGCGIAWEVHPQGGQGKPLSMPTRLALKHIEMVDAIMNDCGFEDMLGRCPDLETLRVVWGDSSRMPTFPLDFSGMGQALRRHARQLRKFSLDCTEELSYTQDNSRGRLGSLRELANLWSLVVAQDVLVGVKDEDPLRLDQVLPDSLKCLRLLSCQEDEEEVDEELAALIQGGRFPKLRRIQMKREEEFAKNADELRWRLWHRWDTIILTKL